MVTFLFHIAIAASIFTGFILLLFSESLYTIIELKNSLSLSFVYSKITAQQK